ECLIADIIYVSDVEGYLVKTVMFELGYLLVINKEIYFREMPQAENLVITMVKEAKDAIISSAELCEKMLIHNQVSQWREWPDQNETRSDGISL
ncbi:MAG: hypothetical protein RSE21_05885, partial [Bacilli bacterium]